MNIFINPNNGEIDLVAVIAVGTAMGAFIWCIHEMYLAYKNR